MKKLFVLFLILFSFHIYAQNNQSTSTKICWGAGLPDAEYVFEDDKAETSDLATSYTAKEIEIIYKNIDLPQANSTDDMYNKKYMCSLLQPYFTFILKGTYDRKELANVTTAFINVLTTEVFINKIQNLDLGIKVTLLLSVKIPVIDGFNGKDKPNDYPDDWKKFSENPKNFILVNLMNNNEKFFLSLKMYLRNKDTNLKDITADDLFGLLTYLNGKQYLDKDYFSHNHPTLGEVSSFDAYGTEVLAELKKTYN